MSENNNEDRIFVFGFKENPCDSCEAGEVGYCENNCYESIMFDHSVPTNYIVDKISFAFMQNGVDENDCKDLAKIALETILEDK